MRCEQCGCSGQFGVGWVALIQPNVETTPDDARGGVFCPRCAVQLFGPNRIDASASAAASDSPPPKSLSEFHRPSRANQR